MQYKEYLTYLWQGPILIMIKIVILKISIHLNYRKRLISSHCLNKSRIPTSFRNLNLFHCTSEKWRNLEACHSSLLFFSANIDISFQDATELRTRYCKRQRPQLSQLPRHFLLELVLLLNCWNQKAVQERAYFDGFFSFNRKRSLMVVTTSHVNIF